MARDYVCLYHSYLDAIQALGDAERGRLMTAMLEYSLTGAAVELSGNEKFVWPLFKAQIDRDMERYKDTCRKNAENGKSGGRPKNPKNPLGFSESEKSQGKGKGEGKGESKGKGNIPPISPQGETIRFVPPSLEEVASYCRDRGSSINPQAFVDHYTSNGWMVGRTKMKDWRAAVRNWERNDRGRSPGKGNIFLEMLEEHG